MHLMRRIKSNKLLSTSFFGFVMKGLAVISGYILTFLISRNYGVEVMGAYSLSITLLVMFSLLSRLGLDTAVIKLIPELIENLNSNESYVLINRSVLLAFVTSLFISILVYYNRTTISIIFFGNKEMTNYIVYVAVAIIPFTIFNINIETLRSFEKINTYSYFKQLSIVITTTLMLSFLINYDIIVNPILIYTISIFIAFIFSSLLLLKLIHFLTYKSLSRKTSYKYILSFSLPMMFASSMAMMMSWTDTLMLGMLSTIESVGIYSIAVKVSSLIGFILIAFGSYSAPRFAKYFSEDKYDEMYQLVQYSSKIMMIIVVPISIILILCSTCIMSIFGEDFTVGSYALIILVIGQTINVLSGSVGNLLNMTNNHKIYMYIFVFSAFINVILNYILITRYGINGAAIATAISVSILNILMIIVVKFKLDFFTFYIPEYLRRIS